MIKRLCVIIVVMSILLSLGVALSAGKLSVVQEQFSVYPYNDYYNAKITAEVENTGDRLVQFNSGYLELYDSQGNVVNSSNIRACYPSVLNPGERGYIIVDKSVKEAKSSDDLCEYMLNVTGKGAIDEEVRRFPSSVRIETFDDYYDYLIVTTTNNTEEEYFSYTALFIIKDSEGKLVSIYTNSPSSVGFLPNMTLEIRNRINDTEKALLNEHSENIADLVDAIVYTTISIE